MSGPLQIPNLALGIVECIRKDRLAPGTRLPSRKLAERLRVSRTPIERALELLEQHQIVRAADAGGYAVHSIPPSLSPEALGAAPHSDDERLYLRIADDHAAGRLPGRASENELMRLYEASRTAIVRVLQRASTEAWAERLPGRGWAFIPLLGSDQTYEHVCRFRIVVEPAAILEPSFVLNRPAIEACYEEQLALFRGGKKGLSPVTVFDSGSRFHQTVLDCSRNPFFINGLRQVNHVRRLVEYRKTPSSRNWLERCRDHARIAELLLRGDRQQASDLLRRHLEEGASEKT